MRSLEHFARLRLAARAGQLCAAPVLALVVIACASQPRTIKIPESAVADPKADKKNGKGAIQPYEIKMSDGERVWHIVIPVTEGTGSFEAMVPLDLSQAPGGRAKPETEADREIKRDRPGKKKPAATPEDSPEASQSYLSSLANVNALFRKKQYELALMELVKLERSYPDDERVLEMKGTLYWRLKKPKLAREAWERVLAINPDNTIVAQALENLLGGE